MLNILLVNPNTNADITDIMVSRAQIYANEVLGDRIRVSGATVVDGESLITDEMSLKRSSFAVISLLSQYKMSDCCGVIVAAFGDPAVKELSLTVPVVGIGESSIQEAKSLCRPFSIVTTTPLLKASMERQVLEQNATSYFGGIIVSAGEPRDVMQSHERLELSLIDCCTNAIEKHHSEIIIIGGGPLASAANVLQKRFPECVILDPIRCAVYSLFRKLDIKVAQ